MLLLDLIKDFEDTGFAILKHNNACGLAIRPVLLEAWKDALAGDPISAFGGVLITNTEVDKETAAEMSTNCFLRLSLHHPIPMRHWRS